MRLLTKNTVLLLLLSLLVFSAGGVIFYAQLRSILNEETEEALMQKKGELKNYLSQHRKFPDALSENGEFSFVMTNEPVTERMIDTTLYNREEDEKLPYKQFHFNLLHEGKNYACTVSKSLLESDDLIETILQAFAIILALLILVFAVVNFWFSRIIWKPFFRLLKRMNEYESEKQGVIKEEGISTLEFRQLSEAIAKMTKKMSDDFSNLKNFTENASHELQTPLAIIAGKTEMLLQSQTLNEEQLKQVIEINQTVNRLSKLNHTLLLLSKIENNQFAATEETDFKTIVNTKLKQFEDLMEMKDLKTALSLNETSVHINAVLADVVVSNLLSNAIKYTPAGGKIRVELNKDSFSISNEGSPLKGSADELFSRFYKENEDASSTGLGLALVKQVARVNGHTVIYRYQHSQHVFGYRFDSAKE